MNLTHTKAIDPNCTRCGARKFTRDPWCSRCNAKCFNCPAEKPKYFIAAYGIKLCGKCHAGEDE